MNDGVLRLELIDEATTIAYADDLGLIVEATDSRNLTCKMDESLERIAD